MPCRALNARGTSCESPEHSVIDGLCAAHRAGGRERLTAQAALGGKALRAKLEGEAFDAADIKPIVTLEDAKLALDEIRVATLTRRITHGEAAAAVKAIDSWVKAEGALSTSRLVGELRAELEAKTREIAALRKQLLGNARALRTAPE